MLRLCIGCGDARLVSFDIRRGRLTGFGVFRQRCDQVWGLEYCGQFVGVKSEGGRLLKLSAEFLGSSISSHSSSPAYPSFVPLLFSQPFEQ